MSKHPYPEHIVEAIKEQLAKGYGDLYVCTRDDSAWSYGTMSLDDFHRLDSDEDVLGDLANDMLEMLWDASRVDTVEDVYELPDDAVLVGRDGKDHDTTTVWYADKDGSTNQVLPAHIVYWGDTDE